MAPLPVPRPLPHVPAEDSNDDQLLHSFSDFISVFESHVQHHGRVHLPHPQRIGELLQELQSALKPHVSPPPRYTEVASYSYLHSSARRSSTELLHLRRENEQLRQVQRQCERLSAQLKESQVSGGISASCYSHLGIPPPLPSSDPPYPLVIVLLDLPS